MRPEGRNEASSRGGFWPGLAWAALSLAALWHWKAGAPCGGGACPGGGQSVFLLGALAYAAAACWWLSGARRQVAAIAACAGAAFHWAVLLGRPEACKVCFRFAAGETVGALACLLFRAKAASRAEKFAAVGPARALALACAALLASVLWAQGRLLPAPLAPEGLPQAGAAAAAVPLDAALSSPGPAPAAARPSPEPPGSPAWSLEVRRPDGLAAWLDLRERPALFFAPWCLHCGGPLAAAASLPEGRRPWLVAVPSGDPSSVREKLASAGLRNVSWYAGSLPEDMRGVPALVWFEAGGLKAAVGEGAVVERLAAPANAALLGKGRVPEDAGGNAMRAAAFLDGAVVPPGAEFSFNRRAGPYDVSRGYGPGRSVVETAYGPEFAPDVGGGACRAATALHRAVLDAGLEVTERHQHALPVAYAPEGDDAAVSWAGQDYRFRNVRTRPVLVRAFREGGQIVVRLYEQR